MKHPSPWDANIRVLKAQYPALAETLLQPDREDRSLPPLPELRVGSSPSGLPTLTAGDIHVHSPRDPLREARRLAETISPEENQGPAIILGFGLGYTAEAAAEQSPGKPLIVVESRREILKKCLESRDLSAFLHRRGVAFVLGGNGEAVTYALRLFEKTSEYTLAQRKIPGTIIKNHALVDMDKEWYDRVEERIRTWYSRDDVNRATLRRFGRRWVRNLGVNMKAIPDLAGISRLAGTLAGEFPVFLAAAGPGLDQTAPLLQEIRRRCVIITVDTALRFFIRQGIDPDFAVSVDPQYWNMRHLDRGPAPRTWLVTESAVYPPILRHPFAGALLCGSFFPLGRFIEDRLEPKGSLGAGGSVATTAWDFARVLGAPSVWIAGLDLSFPDLKTHFRGALFEDRSLTESGRFFPAETWAVKALRDGHPFKAKNPEGGTVLTDKRLSLYAAWFENRFKARNSPRNYSLSTGGLAIEGLETAPPEALLALPPRREEIDALLGETLRALKAEREDPENRRVRQGLYEAARESLFSGLRGVARLAWETGDNARRALHSQDPAGIAACVEKLETAGREIMESEVKDAAGFLFPDPGDLEQKLKTPESDKLKRHLEYSALLYQTLGETTENILKLLGGEE